MNASISKALLKRLEQAMLYYESQGPIAMTIMQAGAETKLLDVIEDILEAGKQDLHRQVEQSVVEEGLGLS